MAEPTTDPRAAQIEAVIGQLDYCGLNPGVGAEYVADRDDQGEAERERHRAQDAVMVEALTQIRRLAGYLPEGVQRAITIAASRIEDLAHEHGQADGYARAVAALRDDGRYEQWWNRFPRHPEATHWAKTGRDHLADYLEAVGPDGTPAPASLGEQSHDPTGCRLGGQPHLGPCEGNSQSTVDSSAVEQIEAALQEHFHGADGYAFKGHTKDPNECVNCGEAAEIVERLFAAARQDAAAVIEAGRALVANWRAQGYDARSHWASEESHALVAALAVLDQGLTEENSDG